mgnify:CR=1 FL=1
MPGHTRTGASHLYRMGLVVILTVLALSASYLPSSAAEHAPPGVVAPQQSQVGYVGPAYGSGANSTPTGEKPESKLWWNDGRWWGAMFSQAAGDYRIFWLDLSTQTWHDTGTSIGNRDKDKIDVLWDQAGQKLYVTSHVFSTSGSSTASNWAQLFRFSYTSSTKTYSPDAGFPVDVSRGRAEALTVDKDSTGRLWVTYVESNKVMVNHSTTNDQTWATPFQLPGSGSVSSDDISSVIAFGGNKIGVVWSNQSSDGYYLAIHNDGAAPNVWTIETAIQGNNLVDDHINLATDSSGRLYLAGKTSLTGNNPLVVLDVRGPSGGWTRYVFGMDADGHTRPIVLVDSQNQMVHMFATAPESGGAIYYKSANMGSISFPPGRGTVFMQAATGELNNSTSTKQQVNTTTGLVVLASNSGTLTYHHNYIPLGGGPPPTTVTPTATTVTPTATTVTPTPTTVTPTPTTVTPTPTTTTPTATPPPGDTLTLAPIADTHVKTDRATANYGTLDYVRVRWTSTVDYDTYFKFDVSGTGGQVSRAILWLYSYDGGPDGGTIYTASNNYLGSSTPWTETGLTWNNAPGMGTPLYSVGNVNTNSWAAWDVTAVIPGDGTYSFGLSSNDGNSVFYYTKEAANFQPRLEITLGGAAAGFAAQAAPMMAAPMIVEESDLGTPLETPMPTVEVITPAPAPAVYTLPYADSFATGAGWIASGAWQFDALAGLNSSGWFANSALRGQSSALQLDGLIDLTSVLSPSLSFWQKSVLSAGDRFVVEASVDGGLTWLPLADEVGAVSDWTQRSLDLSAVSGQLVALRFRLDTTGDVPAGTTSAGLWLDDVAVNLVIETPTPPAETPVIEPPTEVPTEVPTETPTEIVPPVEPPTQEPPSTLLTVESDDPAVVASGLWTAHDTAEASGGRYLYSSGSLTDSLTLAFTGTQVDVVFVMHPALGSFAIEIDGVQQQIVSATGAETVFGARTVVSGLSDGAHSLRIVPVSGTVALDAFAVAGLAPLPPAPPVVEPPVIETPVVPTAGPTIPPQPEILPTATPVPLPLPFFDSFETGLTWQAEGSWAHALSGGYLGGGWTANADTPGQISTLTLTYLLDLRAAQAPQLTFWQAANLAGEDSVSLEVTVDGGLSWLPIDLQRGWNSAWAMRSVDLTGFRGTIIGLRFVLTAGPSGAKGNRSSVFGLDELAIQEAPPPTLAPTTAPLAAPQIIPVDPATPTPEPTQPPAETTTEIIIEVVPPEQQTPEGGAQ